MNKNNKTLERAKRQSELLNLIENSNGISETTIQNVTRYNKSTLSKTLRRYANQGFFKKEKVYRNIYFKTKYDLVSVNELEKQSKICNFLPLIDLKTESVFIEKKGKNILINAFFEPKLLRKFSDSLNRTANTYLKGDKQIAILKEMLNGMLLVKFNIRLNYLNSFNIESIQTTKDNYLDIYALEDNTLVKNLRAKLKANKENKLENGFLVYLMESNQLGYLDNSADKNFVIIENLLDFVMFFLTVNTTNYLMSNKESDYIFTNTLYQLALENKETYADQFTKKERGND